MIRPHNLCMRPHIAPKTTYRCHFFNYGGISSTSSSNKSSQVNSKKRTGHRNSSSKQQQKNQQQSSICYISQSRIFHVQDTVIQFLRVSLQFFILPSSQSLWSVTAAHVGCAMEEESIGVKSAHLSAKSTQKQPAPARENQQ